MQWVKTHELELNQLMLIAPVLIQQRQVLRDMFPRMPEMAVNNVFHQPRLNPSIADVEGI